MPYGPEFNGATIQDLIDISHQLNVDPDALRDAVLKVLGNHGMLEDELKRLANNTVIINKKFTSVSLAMCNFDAKDFLAPDGKPLPKLKPSWESCSKDYFSLMRKSRNFATEVLSRIESYYRIILPNLGKDGNRQDQIQALRYFIDGTLSEGDSEKSEMRTRLENDKKTSETIADGFRVLGDNVATFKFRLEVTIKDAQLAMDAEIQKLKEEVADIKASLKSDQKEDSGSADLSRILAAVGAGMVGCGSGMVATGILAPVGLIVQILGLLVLAGGGAVVFMKFMRGKVMLATAELKVKTAKLRHKDIANSEISAAGGDMIDISRQLVALTRIWSSVRADAHTALIHLSNAAEGPCMYQKSFELATECYERLWLGLKAYCLSYDDNASLGYA